MQNWDISTPYSNIVVYINDITKREPGLVPLIKAQFSTSCNRQGRGHGQTLDNTLRDVNYNTQDTEILLVFFMRIFFGKYNGSIILKCYQKQTVTNLIFFSVMSYQ